MRPVVRRLRAATTIAFYCRNLLEKLNALKFRKFNLYDDRQMGDEMNTRRFRRVPFAAEVSLTVDRDYWAGELIDVAMKGALVETMVPLPIPVGTRCELGIALPGTAISLDFGAELVYIDGLHYGFKFISENIETLTHLRKLIELNTGDVETTRSELSAWLKD